MLFSITIHAQKNTVKASDFGAIVNDGKDDTFSLQKAIDHLSKNKGGTLVLDKGSYNVSHLSFIGLQYSNITMMGQGANITIIKQILPNVRRNVRGNKFSTYATRTAGDGILVFDANVSNQKNDDLSIKNILIAGLSFVSEVEKFGFDELSHQISAHGVSGFTVSNCNFTGFLGDAVSINGSTDFSKNRDAYNKNIKISECKFDGVNKNNRQAISIYYSDGFVIEKCSFKNTTRDDMPGAIDIEADQDFNISRNGKILNCSFENIGGIGAICIVLKPSVQLNDYSNKNFLIDGCTFTKINTPLAVIGNSGFKTFDSGKGFYITFSNSTVDTSASIMDLRSAYGIRISNISFSNISSKILNVVSDVGGRAILFENCSFRNVTNPNGLGFTGDTSEIDFVNCRFENFSIHAITINSVKGARKFINNKFISTSYKGGEPLVIPYYSNRRDVSHISIKNNHSQGNFLNLDVNHYFKKK